MIKQATLKDVAKVCGVSSMTVSNVLNGRDKEVGAKTRERILDAIAELGYRQNLAAKRLRAQKTSSIGMLILDDVSDFLNDPFIAQVVSGLSNHATEKGYNLILQGLRSDMAMSSSLLGNLRTDGLCATLSGTSDQRRAFKERLATLGIPVVLIQEEFDHPLVCGIRQDDYTAAAEIAEYLVAQGARNLHYLSPSAQWPAIKERIAGTTKVCEAVGGSVKVIDCGDEGFKATQSAVSNSIGLHGLPDVFVGGNDRMAMATLRLLIDRGIRIPEDVCVTGFNSFDFAAFAQPKLLTAQSPAHEMGRLAGVELVTAMESGKFQDRAISLPITIVRGQSA